MDAYQTNHLDASRIEFILELCKGSKLSRTHGRKVGRMTEENSPFVVQKLVEVLLEVSMLFAASVEHPHHVAMSSLRLEVRRCA
jgi:hypothetical protein